MNLAKSIVGRTVDARLHVSEKALSDFLKPPVPLHHHYFKQLCRRQISGARLLWVAGFAGGRLASSGCDLHNSLIIIWTLNSALAEF